MNNVGIDFLTGFGMSPVALANVAADLGCPTFSLILAPIGFNPENVPVWSMRDDPALQRELKAVQKDRGVKVSMGEGFLVSPERDVREAYARDLELMAELGAPRVCVVSFDPDEGRTLDQFGLFAEMVAGFGMTTVTEFAPVFLSVRNLSEALAAKKHVGRSDFRVLMDTMHFFRTGGKVADLKDLPADTFGYIQLCDAPTKPTMPDYMDECMSERWAPGDGDAPLGEILAALPYRQLTVSLEVPLRAEAESGRGPQVRIGRIVDQARRLLESLPGQTA